MCGHRREIRLSVLMLLRRLPVYRTTVYLLNVGLRNVSMEMRHRFDLISVEMQPPFGLNSRLQVD